MKFQFFQFIIQNGHLKGSQAIHKHQPPRNIPIPCQPNVNDTKWRIDHPNNTMLRSK